MPTKNIDFTLQAFHYDQRLTQIDQQIKWTKSALNAPDEYVNEPLQALRKQTLILLSKELANVTFMLTECRLLASKQTTKKLLHSMGERFHVAGKGTFYLHR